MTEVDYTQLEGEALLQAAEAQAVANGVSDIHFSPEKDFVRFEWRKHGVLRQLANISHDAYITVVRIIKFLSKLKLNITMVPQDGQYGFQIGDRMVNVRVATLPTK